MLPHKYQFCTIWTLLYTVHMLCLVANSTSPYYYDLLPPLLLLSPILLPFCQLTWYFSPMGSPFKIVSNLGRLFISLSIVTMWGNIAINNAKATSFFKQGPLLVSSNVKLACFSHWRLLMVNPARSPPSSYYTKHDLDLNHIQTYWFLGYTTPKTFDKTNNVV
jgi:hypothetical protein